MTRKRSAQLDNEIAQALKIDKLRAAWEKARHAAALEPTAEKRTAAKEAWATLDAASPRTKKKTSFASRAGRRQAAERRHSHATKKSGVQLDSEIDVILAAGPSVKISVHEVHGEKDEDEGDDDGDDANNGDDEPHYVISDNGGEFDDSEETCGPDVQGNIDERRLHYSVLGRRVSLDAPAGSGWH